MKRISRMFYFALLLLVGTVCVQNTACCNALTATPSTLTFNVTSSPSVPQSYTLTNVSDQEDVIVKLTPSKHTQIAISPNGTYFTTSFSVYVPKNNGTVTINVKVVTDSLISILNETIANDGCSEPYADLEAYAPVQISGQAPLPIQLSLFKATTLVNNGVTLTWTTVSETNNYGFNVQRNGANIAFIQGHGTTVGQHTYSYTDDPGPGKYLYRLQQVDLNGMATLSESILMDVAGKFTLNQNYPNPFNPSTQIAFSVTKEGPVSLRVYDVLGREVATLVNENRKPGQYTERFDGTRFASGLYMYVLRNSEGQLTCRMILSK